MYENARNGKPQNTLNVISTNHQPQNQLGCNFRRWLYLNY